ncbi:MAG TPA: helix-turn-helix domain-containing protein [Acidimicrobiales bacterium]|jgi:excisionase family DNA binding protein|nr:helix-turn-helix domain-containing protein [Acidimicrobiales bacterium]
MPDDAPEQLTLSEAAEMLRISPATLARWAAEGRIASEVTPEGVRVFRRSELLKTVVRPGEDERDEEE